MNYIKFLGAYLSFKVHIEKLNSKLVSIIYLSKRISETATANVMLYFDMDNLVNRIRVFKLQKMVIGAIAKISIFTSNRPYFEE